jgi:hypothetical protein
VQEKTRDWSIVDMTPRAREHYEKRFIAKYKRYINQVNQTPLTLLVWGPGESGGDLYAKRLQIRALLRERGFAAVFSEEIEKDYPVSGLSSKAKEILQACSADLIVVLQCSFGSTAEVHDFASFVRDIGHKMMIFVNREIENGYSYTGALTELNLEYGNVHLFDYPKDVEECHLATMVIDRAEALRHAQWRRKHLR